LGKKLDGQFCRLRVLSFGDDDPTGEIGDDKGNDPGGQPYKDKPKPQQGGVNIEQLPETTHDSGYLFVFPGTVDSFHWVSSWELNYHQLQAGGFSADQSQLKKNNQHRNSHEGKSEKPAHRVHTKVFA